MREPINSQSMRANIINMEMNTPKRVKKLMKLVFMTVEIEVVMNQLLFRI